MRLIAFDALTEEDVAAWRDLAERAVEPNAFFAPGYALPLAKHLGGEPELLVAGDWAAALPVTRAGRFHRAPIPALMTWRPHFLYSLLGTPLVDRDRVEEGCAALLEAVRERTRTFAALEWLDADGPVARALAPHAYEFERFERAALHRRPEPTYTAETVSSKHRREYRRQRRKLEEELGAVTVREIDSVDGLIAMEAASGVAEPIASDPRVAAFFREIDPQVLELAAGGTPLAYKANLAAGDGLFMLKIAFDEAFGRYSPGMQLELEMLNFFHGASKINWMDSCADANNAMINRLWPDRRTLTTLVIGAPGPRGIAALGAVRALRAVRDRRNQP